MKLDHVVYFTTQTPDEVVKEQRRTDKEAISGGRHESWGTYNALFYVGNAYIEWLAVEDRELAENANHPLVDLLIYDLKDGEGWGTICLSVNDIGKLDNEIQQKGFRTSGIIDAQRTTAEGKLRKWKMLFIEQSISDRLPYPFFIEWEEQEESRLVSLLEDGSLTPANENLHITDCVFHVADPKQATSSWSSLLGIEADSKNTITLPNVILHFEANPGEKERLVNVKMNHADASKQKTPKYS